VPAPKTVCAEAPTLRGKGEIRASSHGPLMQSVRDGTRWMLRLDDGQDLFEALSAFARENDIGAAAVLFGIGMFRSAAFGYWDGQQYRPHEISTSHEVVALHGTIARADGVPSVHLHAAASGPDHRLVGGHLLRATVGVLQEVMIETFPARVFDRPMVESWGLRMLDLGPSGTP
jgi:predicted DNA-binding protein with PD1-like motif